MLIVKRILWILPLIMLFTACNDSGDNNQSDDVSALPTRAELPSPDPNQQPTPQPDLIEFWIPVQGELIVGEASIWRFVGQTGDNITLRAIAQGINTTLTLQGTDGNALAMGESIEATLPVQGLYTVLIEGDLAGRYELGLGYADRPNPNDATPVPAVVGVPTPSVPFEGRGTFISNITSNNTIGGQLSESDQNHIYTFDGVVGEYIQLELNRVSGTIDPVITIYDPEGIPMAIDDNSGGERNAILRNIQIINEGLHTIQVNGDGFPGNYSLRLFVNSQAVPITPTTLPTPTPTPTINLLNPSPVPLQIGNRLEDHQLVLGMLDRPGDVVIHPFYLGVGQIVTIGVSPAIGSVVRPRIEVLNPEGVIVATATASTSNAGGDALITPLFAEIEGVYQIFVTGEDNVIGEYVIGFGSGSTWLNVIRGTVSADTPVEAIIERRGQRDAWLVALGEGDIISAAVSANDNSALDPILELVPVDDTPIIIAIDDNGGGDFNPLLNNIRITESGLYYLRIKASQAATIGSYTLIWRYVNRAPTATPFPATSPIITVDDFVTNDSYNFYPFQGNAGQIVRIEVIASEDSLLDPIVALVGIDGEVLLEVDDSEGDLNSRFTVTLPEDGTYNIRVNGYLSEGAFELTVEQLFN